MPFVESPPVVDVIAGSFNRNFLIILTILFLFVYLIVIPQTLTDALHADGIEMVDDNMYFATPKTMEWIDKLKQESKKNGTVGCVVLDSKGNLTAGTSTGGMFKKQWGRIGDSLRREKGGSSYLPGRNMESRDEEGSRRRRLFYWFR